MGVRTSLRYEAKNTTIILSCVSQTSAECSPVCVPLCMVECVREVSLEKHLIRGVIVLLVWIHRTACVTLA